METKLYTLINTGLSLKTKFETRAKMKVKPQEVNQKSSPKPKHCDW